jgi:hypothetical protein
MARHTTKYCELEKDEIRLEVTLQITEQIHSIPAVFGHCNRSECSSSLGPRCWSQVSSFSSIPYVSGARVVPLLFRRVLPPESCQFLESHSARGRSQGSSLVPVPRATWPESGQFLVAHVAGTRLVS